MIDTPNILLISGSGQNVGKTTFSCELISKFSMHNKVVGVKISPHFHKLDDDCEYIVQNEDAVIVREQNKERKKDSGYMLQAGAEDVYYIQTKTDKALESVLPNLLQVIGNRLCVCESGGIGKFIKPSVWIHVMHSQSTKYDLPQADAYIADYNFAKINLDIIENSWILV